LAFPNFLFSKVRKAKTSISSYCYHDVIFKKTKKKEAHNKIIFKKEKLKQLGAGGSYL
jgi:hypothetical protein